MVNSHLLCQLSYWGTKKSVFRSLTVQINQRPRQRGG